MRPLALALCLAAGCSAFHANPTVKSAKETVKALPDLVDSIKALVAALSTLLVEKLGAALEALASLLPRVEHLTETVDTVAHRTDDLLRWGLYVLIGSVGGYFSILKTAGGRWLWRKLGLARKKRRAKRPGGQKSA